VREAPGGRTHPNINPPPREVIGVAADATAEDMLEPSGGAVAFDEGIGGRPQFRARCLRQLHEALLTKATLSGRPYAPKSGRPSQSQYGAVRPALDNPPTRHLAENYAFVEDLGIGDVDGG